MTLAVDRAELAQFVKALFADLDPWGYVSLRAFRQFPPKGEPDPPLHIEAVRLNTGLEPVIDAAERIATRVSNGGEAAVFAPPLATFVSRTGAKSSDVHEAPVLSVEIDQGDLHQIADSLTLVLGVRPTIMLTSGSLWTDPTTGELLAKGHLHWRLRIPARGPERLHMLRRARDIATMLAGGDPSGTPPVHPLRWPGSWNRKTEPPVMARIIEANTATVDLTEALDALEDAAQASNLATPKNTPHLAADLPAELAQLAEWLTFYTTACLRPADQGLWHDWNNVAMAIHKATGGSADGYELFRTWSATSTYYNAADCRARWHAITECPATWIGARWLRNRALERGWIAPQPEPPPGWEDAHPPSDNVHGPQEAPKGRHKRRTGQPPPYAAADSAGLWDPWEDPPPPAWPNAILSRAAEDTLALVSLRDGIDIGTLAMSIIAAGSATAPKDARFFAYNQRETGWRVPPILWLMLIGNSGLRKTALDQTAFSPLRHAQNDLWRPYTQAMRDWKRAPRKGRGPQPEEPHSFIVDDITPEKLGDILASTTRGTAMVKDELAGLFEFDRYRKGSGAAGRGFYLSAYEDNPTTVHRISRESQNIEHPGLSIFGGIQAARLAEFKDLATDGLLQRFAPLRTPPTLNARPEIDIGTGLYDLHHTITRLCKLDGRNYITTSEGTALIQDTERTARGYAAITDFSEGWSGFCLKLHGTHARLALILHLLETPQEPLIITDTVERAHRLTHSFVLQHARDFYSTTVGANQDRLRDIAGWLLTREDSNPAPDQWERIVASDVTHHVKACRSLTSKGISDVLDPFITRGWLVPERDYPGNRAWLFDPAIRILLAQRQQDERERRAAIRAQIDGIAAKRKT